MDQAIRWLDGPYELATCHAPRLLSSHRGEYTDPVVWHFSCFEQ
jgi:hypothetical protein